MTESARHPAVLIVDDSLMIRSLLEVALSNAGFIVRVAGTGAEALAMARTGGIRFDAAILDVRLPDDEGPNVLRLLRALLPSLPCCFITGDAGDLSDEHLLTAEDGVRVFNKPFSIPMLMSAIQELTGGTAS